MTSSNGTLMSGLRRPFRQQHADHLPHAGMAGSEGRWDLLGIVRYAFRIIEVRLNCIRAVSCTVSRLNHGDLSQSNVEQCEAAKIEPLIAMGR